MIRLKICSHLLLIKRMWKEWKDNWFEKYHYQIINVKIIVTRKKIVLFAFASFKMGKLSRN